VILLILVHVLLSFAQRCAFEEHETDFTKLRKLCREPGVGFEEPVEILSVDFAVTYVQSIDPIDSLISSSRRLEDREMLIK
jgi:hypothetical protein